jgi:hypothetical protein
MPAMALVFGLRGKRSKREGIGPQAAPIFQLQLTENIRYVEFDGPLRDRQRSGNLLIG